MQTFQDSATLKVWQFEDDVLVTEAAGAYAFKTALGVPLNVPTTLQPYTIPAPTAAQLLTQAQQAKIAAINASYAQNQAAGFTSSALGSPHTYPSDTVAQTQLGGRVTEAHIHLLAPSWAPGVAKAVGNWVSAGGWLYQYTLAGITGSTAPTWPTVQGATGTDGNAAFVAYRQWGGYFLCTDSSGNTASQPHTQDQMWQVGLDAAANIDSLMAHRLNLIGQVNAATTVTAVNAVPNW